MSPETKTEISKLQQAIWTLEDAKEKLAAALPPNNVTCIKTENHIVEAIQMIAYRIDCLHRLDPL